MFLTLPPQKRGGVFDVVRQSVAQARAND